MTDFRKNWITVSRVPGIGDGNVTRELMYVIVVSTTDYGLDVPYEDRMVIRRKSIWIETEDSTFTDMWLRVVDYMAEYDIPIQNLIRVGV